MSLHHGLVSVVDLVLKIAILDKLSFPFGSSRIPAIGHWDLFLLSSFIHAKSPT
jgi:hypothetical protein